MKVLIIAANSLPASPAGPAYIAGAARQAGHTVEVFDGFLSQDLENELSAQLQRFQPDVVGVSIRIVVGYVVDGDDLKTFDARGRVKEIVEIVKRCSNARIVLGGPGFNYYGPAWLNYLDLDYGIRGESEFAFPLYLERLPYGDIATIPGAIFRQGDRFIEMPRDRIENLDATALPAYDLFDLPQYRARGISPAIFSKRGCAFGCTFCPYTALEGTRHRLKSPRRVVDEMIATHSPRVSICENSFNVPHSHAESICYELIKRQTGVQWATDSLKPLKITDDFVRLMVDAGCVYGGLSIETASPSMLRSMNRRYTVDDIRQAMASLTRSDLPWGLSLMFGCPGETPETIAETFALVDEFPTPPMGVWVSVGICLWTDYQAILADARREGQLTDDRQLFEGANYISPALPKTYMEDLIASIRAREGYTVQVNKLYAETA